MNTIIQFKHLNVRFKTSEGWGYALTDINAKLKEAKVTAIIGESGSGKSILGSSIVGLLPENAVITGSIFFKGKELLSLSDKEMDQIRGREIGWIAQNASSALNQIYPLGELISEGPVYHDYIKPSEKIRLAKQYLKKCS